MTDPAKFIHALWRMQTVAHEGPRYGATARKDWDTGDWHDWVKPWKANRLPVLPDEPDLYFAPTMFAGPQRVKENALQSRILFADLDEVDPTSLDIVPTLAWETSPQRYQCLWVMNRALPADEFEKLNQRLTYATGADKGGWSCTKVLRVPGSVSTKYGRSRAKRFTVQLVGGRGPTYTVSALRKRLRGVRVGPPLNFKDVFDDEGPLPDRKEVMREWRKRLPPRAVRLLAAKHVPLGADRSAKLWELYNVLLQAGMRPAEVMVAVQGSVWNKYHGQHRELVQLQREIAKAASKHAQPEELERLRRPQEKKTPLKGATTRKLEKRKRERPDKLPYLSYDEFMSKAFPSPEWLVEGFWTKGAYGFCAGEYKSFKTMTLLNLAVSVATGTPFLGKFLVPQAGKVLYVHEEGREGSIQDRLLVISSARGEHPNTNGKTKRMEVELKGPNIDVSSHPGLNLRDPDSQRQLVTYLGEEKPALVILESWYLMASEISETNQQEVAPILKWLGRVARDFGVSLIISHHYNKSHQEAGVHRRALDRVSGSTVFNRWWESVILLERSKDENDYSASIEAAHRDQKGVTKQTMRVEMDLEDEENFTYEVTLVEGDIETTAQKEQQIVKAAAELAYGPHGHVNMNDLLGRVVPLGWTKPQILELMRKAGWGTKKVRRKGDPVATLVFYRVRND